MQKNSVFIFILFSFCIINIYGQKAPLKIAIIPFHTFRIDSSDVSAAESILRKEIRKQSSLKIIRDSLTKNVVDDSTCYEKDCALEIGRKLNADLVLDCRLSDLFGEIVFQYFIVDVPTGKEILLDQITTSSIDDLKSIMKKAAISIVKNKPVEQGDGKNITQ